MCRFLVFAQYENVSVIISSSFFLSTPAPTYIFGDPNYTYTQQTEAVQQSNERSFFKHFLYLLYLLLYSHLRREVYFLCAKIILLPEPIHPSSLGPPLQLPHIQSLSLHCFPGLKTNQTIQYNKIKHKNEK